MKSETAVKIERLKGGKPILASEMEWAQKEGATNPGAVYLPNTPENARIIDGLLGKGAARDARTADGIVAAIFTKHGCQLAVFTPQLDLLKWFDKPLIQPTGNPGDVDCAGTVARRASTRTPCWRQFSVPACGTPSRDLMRSSSFPRVNRRLRTTIGIWNHATQRCPRIKVSLHCCGGVSAEKAGRVLHRQTNERRLEQ